MNTVAAARAYIRSGTGGVGEGGPALQSMRSCAPNLLRSTNTRGGRCDQDQASKQAYGCTSRMYYTCLTTYALDDSNQTAAAPAMCGEMSANSRLALAWNDSTSTFLKPAPWMNPAVSLPQWHSPPQSRDGLSWVFGVSVVFSWLDQGGCWSVHLTTRRISPAPDPQKPAAINNPHL
jgi:hypothetical protein